jgi:hypothetical protein
MKGTLKICVRRESACGVAVCSTLPSLPFTPKEGGDSEGKEKGNSGAEYP